jgi:predicted Zn-dependent peptidase
MNSITTKTLPNGLRVGIDQMKEVDTVSVVFGTGIGARDENKATNGISHFLEHMAFKGTKKRNYLQIAEAIDDIGGSMNAYTSKENTMYYVKVMKEDLDVAIDVISDIVRNSVFDQEEIDKESGVILQELAASMDDPTDVAFYNFYEQAYTNQPLGRKILGEVENIKSFKTDDFKKYISKYNKDNCFFAICGNVDEDSTFKLSEEYFSDFGINSIIEKPEPVKYIGNKMCYTKKDLEQVQYVLGFEGKSYYHDDYHLSNIAANILGGGMSSRLFQEVREKMGLVYTISCWNDAYKDHGLFSIYAGTSSENVSRLNNIIKSEMAKMSESITDQELKRVKKQYQTSIIMHKESTNSRAMKLAKNFISYNKYIDYEEVMEKINAISKADVCNFMSSITNAQSTNQVIYGNIENTDFYS